MVIDLVMYRYHIMVAMKVNIFEAKARLSELVDAAQAGTPVTICRRNRPVAQLVSVTAARTAERPVGGARGDVFLSPAFFDPLPESVIETFYPRLDSETPGLAAADGPPVRRSRPVARPHGRRS